MLRTWKRRRPRGDVRVGVGRDGDEWERMKLESRFESKREEIRGKTINETFIYQWIEEIQLVVMDNQINNQLSNQVDSAN